MVVIPSSLTDHPSLLGIVRMPKCSYKSHEVDIPILTTVGTNWVSITQKIELAEWIKSGTNESQTFSVTKDKTTDFYPYTYYILTDGETEPLLMQPQYLPNSFSIKAKYALSHQPIERYFPSNYKGSTDGVIYNITNTNQMMLPTGSNEGISYMMANASSMRQGVKNQKYDVISGAINSTASVISSAVSGNYAGAITGGISGVLDIGSGINNIKMTNARNRDILATPSSISNWGTVSTRQAFNTDSVRLVKYTIKDEMKNKINNFVQRYGNKYNNYAEIDHTSYKGYLKMISPDIDSGIDNIFLNQIKGILERGIYFE